MKQYNDFYKNPFISFIKGAMDCSSKEELQKYSDDFWVVISEADIQTDLLKNLTKRTLTFVINPICLFSVEPSIKEFVKEFGDFMNYHVHTYIPSIDKEMPDEIKCIHGLDLSNKENPPKIIKFGNLYKVVSCEDEVVYYDGFKKHNAIIQKAYVNFEKDTTISLSVARQYAGKYDAEYHGDFYYNLGITHQICPSNNNK